MLHPITDFASSPRGKWITIALWLLVTVAIVPFAPTLEEVTENDQGAFLPNDAESTRVVELVEERFPADGTPAIVVFRNPGGLTDADRVEVQRINDWLLNEAPPNVDRTGVVSIFTQPQAASSLVSADGTTMTLIANITGEPAEDPYVDTIQALRDEAEREDGPLEIAVSGPGGLLADLLEVFLQIDGFLLLVTGVLVLVLLVLIYRSPVVALVPLFAVGWVFTLASGIGALAADRFGLPINGQSQGIMTVLLFGAGTDYCLFIASRFREELTHAADKHAAMRRTMRAVGEAIASSAGTVLVATLALLFATLRSNQSLGPLLAVAVGTMLVAGLTLVPAILAVLGRFAFWPFRPRFDPAQAAIHVDDEAHGIWSRIASAVSARPVAFLVSTVAIFVLLAGGVFRLEQNFDSLTSLPEGTESREGFEFLRAAFPAGDLSPTDVYVVSRENAATVERLDQLDAFARGLAGFDGVANVTGPANPFGVGAPVGAAEVAAAAAAIPPPVKDAIDRGEGLPADAAADPALADQIGLYATSRRLVSPDGGVAQLAVTLDENPYSLSAVERVDELRAFAREQARAAGLNDAEILVGGETAVAYDTKQANDRDIRVVFPIILLAIGLILGVLLRSAVAPIYLLATVVLSYFATLGFSTVFFQDVLGHEGVGAGVPFFLFVFLVALGVDYNIFLMARVREETLRHGLRAGTRRALGRTGGVITSAGIILAGTFAALMTLPLQDLFQTGFAVAAGVLVDTFIVRSLMVPAIVFLLGKWNWWPSGERGEDIGRSREGAAVVGR